MQPPALWIAQAEPPFAVRPHRAPTPGTKQPLDITSGAACPLVAAFCGSAADAMFRRRRCSAYSARPRFRRRSVIHAALLFLACLPSSIPWSSPSPTLGGGTPTTPAGLSLPLNAPLRVVGPSEKTGQREESHPGSVAVPAGLPGIHALEGTKPHFELNELLEARALSVRGCRRTGGAPAGGIWGGARASSSTRSASAKPHARSRLEKFRARSSTSSGAS